MMTNYKLYEMSKEVANNLIQRGIPIHKCSVTISNRLTACFGKCSRKVKCGEVIYSIKIAGFLAEHGDEHGIKSTIAHEYIHTCDGCMNHGKLWKKYGDMVSDLYDISRCDTFESKGISNEVAQTMKVKRDNSYKYAVLCENCGRTWKYKRVGKVIKNIDKLICPYCNGKKLSLHNL